MIALTAAAACIAQGRLLVCRALRSLDADDADEVLVVAAVLTEIVGQLEAIGSRRAAHAK